MTEFWESGFIEKQTMWGFEPSDSAIMAKELFLKENLKDILIPGIGYGRNAKIFLDEGMSITGIEISKTAIELARTQNNLTIQIYHGPVNNMPFDDKLYDGIFCYALIHLLNSRERKAFIQNCYSQLKPHGYMIFSTISKNDSQYGKGRQVSKDRFATVNGVQLFFYDRDSILQEFSKYGLVDFPEIEEPIKFKKDHPPMKFTVITCKKSV